MLCVYERNKMMMMMMIIARCLHVSPYFQLWAIRRCHLNFFPVNPVAMATNFETKLAITRPQ